MTQKQPNEARRNAIKDRGIIYLSIFRELRERYGEEEAVSVMRAASRAHGIDVGNTLKRHDLCDFEGMLENYFNGPDDGAVYSPKITKLSDTCLDIQMMTCPLKESWVEAGCSDKEVQTLLRCATAYDEGVYEAAGFTFELQQWSPGQAGCCRTKLTVKSN